MNLIHTTIGELYNSLSTLEIKQLDNYIRANGSGKTYNLHALMVKLVKQNNLVDKDYEFVKKKLYKSTPINHSSFTTIVNLLITEVKEYLLMTKIKEKNIYTETLWGEVLIERRLRRNQTINLKNYKLNLYKDQYALQKEFYHQRERFFYNYSNYTKKNIKNIRNAMIHQIESFKHYTYFQKFEMYISYLTLEKQSKEKINYEIDDLKELIDSGVNSKNEILNIQALMMSLTLEGVDEHFQKLCNIFINKFDSLSSDLKLQIFPILLNFCIRRAHSGCEEYDRTAFEIQKFIIFFGILLNYKI